MPIVFPPPSQQGYVAPTVYKLAGKTVSNRNYYNTFADALAKYLYLYNNPAGRNVSPAGNIPFSGTAAATLGINVDFYIPGASDQTAPWVPAPYAYIKENQQAATIFSFYKNNGAGPYWCIMDWVNFGTSATVVSNIDPDKLAALDDFHRQVQLLKAKHNQLAIFLRDLSSKQLSAVEQQVFNNGLLLLTNLRAEINQVNGISVVYGKEGQIGLLGVDDIVIAIIVVAVVAAWAASSINAEIQKTKKLNASYDMQKWVEQQKLAIARDGSLTAEQKKQLTDSLNDSKQSAIDNANSVTAQSKSLWDRIETYALLFGGFMILNNITKK